ncbi:MAG: serine/threonine protein kinase [Arenimonas sp.]|nr:serine/threonine protein kinase [Arenimonas sp.]
MDPTPYADLTPDRILDAVESLGPRSDGRVLALNSYENRVYRVGMEDAPALVAKFYRPGRWTDAAIGEEHAFSAQLVAADLSVVAPLAYGDRTLHPFEGHRFALFPLRGGHAPEPGHRDTLRHIGRVLGRLHAVGDGERYGHRGVMDIDSHGHDPIDYLLDTHWLPPELASNFERLAEALLDAMHDCWDRAGAVHTLRIHGDCHPGNILWREDQAHFVDLDDTLTGPAVQDLWMLAGRREDGPQALRWLLEGYEQFRPFDRRELHLVEPLRTLRLLHYNAWIARRWHDPAFPAAFPWFEAPRHWETVITQMQEQLAALQEPPPNPD